MLEDGPPSVAHPGSPPRFQDHRVTNISGVCRRGRHDLHGVRNHVATLLTETVAPCTTVILGKGGIKKSM